MFSNTYRTDFALNDETFKENKEYFVYTAEYAYELYKNEIEERADLGRVTIYGLGTEITVRYEYDDGEERAMKLSDEVFADSFANVRCAFPHDVGEDSVYMIAESNNVRFLGHEYSLYYSPFGGKPVSLKNSKLKSVELFSDKWYHCYLKD